MKPFAACVVAVTLLSGALSMPSEVSKWENFKVVHGKKHAVHEESARMKAFLERDAEVEAHNARYAKGLESYSRQHNKYSDLTHEEFRKFALGFIPLVNGSDVPTISLPTMPNAPAAFDWTTTGIMTPVRDQAYCGSCYAFASGGVLEAYLKWKTNGQVNVDVSEQDVVDCSYRKFMGGQANVGCEGGFPNAVFDYYRIKDIVQEYQYPYVSGNTNQHYACRNVQAANLIRGKINGVHGQARDEDALAEIIMQKGPIVIGMAADGPYKQYLMDLGNGIFDNPLAINAQPNHVVVLTGFGEENGKRYWRIKNSWGTRWGVGGYGKIVRGKNMCNLMASGVWFVEGL